MTYDFLLAFRSISRLAVDMKFRTYIHIHRFYVDIHGYTHIHRCLYLMYTCIAELHGKINV